MRDEIGLVTRKTRRRLVIPLAPPLREHLLTLAGSDKPSAPLHPRVAALVAGQGGQVMTLSNQIGELLALLGSANLESTEAVVLGAHLAAKRQVKMRKSPDPVNTYLSLSLTEPLHENNKL